MAMLLDYPKLQINNYFRLKIAFKVSTHFYFSLFDLRAKLLISCHMTTDKCNILQFFFQMKASSNNLSAAFHL